MTKNIIKFGLWALIISGSFALSSCGAKIEGCTDPTAENYNPDADLEDASCITQRQKFLGLYSAGDACNLPPAPQGYFMEVRKSNWNLDDILLFNLSDRFFNPVVATVNRTSFTIERQDPDANGTYIQGTGSIAGNEITIQYELRYGSNALKVCIINMVK
ncbi:MAG: hypothetical protein KDC13_01865 [Bacteroidetes bacterium]|nr:hypothetical protein [Bacteroidota bacterium]